MKFLYPEILWGLLALVIPILVHLFNFRRFKKVLFSNVDFLRDIKQETQSKSKLKHLLILISRLLAIASIVLAFAQPFIPSGEETKPSSNAISLYIDNSFSMEAENESGRLLDIAKNKALELLDVYKNTDKFQLITNDFEGRHQRLVSRDEMLDLIEEVKLSPNTKRIDEVLSRQKDVLGQEKESGRTSYILSDLQKSSLDFSLITSDSLMDIVFVPTESNEVSNCYIDSVWFQTPIRQLNQSEQLHISIANESGKKVRNLPVKLLINGAQKALGSFDLEAESRLDTILNFTNTQPGIKSAKIELSDFPIEFDNNYYFSFEVVSELKVYEIKGKGVSNSAVSKVFSDDSFFTFSSDSDTRINYEKLQESNFIILNEIQNISSGLSNEVNKFIENGGSAYLIPSANLNKSTYNSFMQKIGGPLFGDKINGKNAVVDLNQDHPIYQGVFETIPKNMNLPELSSYYPLELQGRNSARVLLRNRDQSPFLTENKVGKGNLFTNCVSLKSSESNFAQHALFVASIVRMAEFSQPNPPLQNEIGSGQSIEFRNGNLGSKTTVKIKSQSGDFEFLPGIRPSDGNYELFIEDQIREDGLYDIIMDESKQGNLGFNYSRKESQLDSYSISELKEQLSLNNQENIKILEASTDSIASKAEEIGLDAKLWRIFIILALVFLIIEILLIKFWK